MPRLAPAPEPPEAPIEGAPLADLRQRLAAFLSGLPPGEVLLLTARPAFSGWLASDAQHVVTVGLAGDTSEPGPRRFQASPDRPFPFGPASLQGAVVLGLGDDAAASDLGSYLREVERVTRGPMLSIDLGGGGARSEAAWRELGARVDPVPTTGEGVTMFRASFERSPAELERLVDEERKRNARVRAELVRAQQQVAALQAQLHAVQASSALSLGQAMLSAPGARGMAKAVKAAQRTRDALRDRGFFWPATTDRDYARLTAREPLAFEGIARRASPADPERFLKDQPELVLICHPEWRGIRAATYGQGTHVLEIPGFASERHARRVAFFVRDAGAKRVVVNGFPPGTELLAKALKDVAPEVRFVVVFHGSPSSPLQEHEVVQRVLSLYDDRRLWKVGFLKHGLSEYFRQRGYPAEYVMNICDMDPQPPAPIAGRTRIGVLAPPHFHKNVETQLVAALMVPGAEIHTLEPVQTAYLQHERSRIVEHGLMARPRFLEFLTTMHATTYVSLVECYPMTVLESIFSGAPALTSHTSRIFEGDAELEAALVVQEHDSPAAIARQLSEVLERREELVPRAQQYLQGVNALARARWRDFLEL